MGYPPIWWGAKRAEFDPLFSRTEAGRDEGGDSPSWGKRQRASSVASGRTHRNARSTQPDAQAAAGPKSSSWSAPRSPRSAQPETGRTRTTWLRISSVTQSDPAPTATDRAPGILTMRVALLVDGSIRISEPSFGRTTHTAPRPAAAPKAAPPA